jgi:hypothetical protein
MHTASAAPVSSCSSTGAGSAAARRSTGRASGSGCRHRRAGNLPPPTTVDEALEQVDQLRRPIAIQVRPVGKYTEIVGVRFN